jgi:RNA polymerase sigma factor (sigma-70 family)
VTVDDDRRLGTRFEASRARLRAVAYRMLGDGGEADDAVQDSWVRLQRAGHEDLENLEGWLTTVVSRVCLDRLRARRARPEDSVGAPVPDALLGCAKDPDPAEQAVLADYVGSALLVVLDSLAPAERVAFVLHDVFGVPFDEISPIVERTPDATRQLTSRARRRIRRTGTVDVDLVRHTEIVDAFFAASRNGDFEALLVLLDPDVAFRPDATAIRMGAPSEMHGSNDVATQFVGRAQGAQRALVAGRPGLAWAPGGNVRGVFVFRIEDDRIAEIEAIGNRERVAKVDVVLLDS